MTTTIITRRATETARLGGRIAVEILQSVHRTAAVVALQGELGAGKTTFVQGFARRLGARQRALSPTFIVMQPIPIRAGRVKALWHIDCYRLKKLQELKRLGFRELLEDPTIIVVLEWAEKVRRLLPKDATWIRFEHGTKANERIISIKNSKS